MRVCFKERQRERKKERKKERNNQTKHIPIIILVSSSLIGLPAIYIPPAEGKMSPVTMFKVVLLPAPLIPSNPKRSPGRSAKLTWIIHEVHDR